jgi:hypothetical protein
MIHVLSKLLPSFPRKPGHFSILGRSKVKLDCRLRGNDDCLCVCPMVCRAQPT